MGHSTTELRLAQAAAYKYNDTGPAVTVAMSSANGLVGTGFTS